MKKFVLCWALLCSTAVFAEDAGAAVKIDAGVVVVEMSSLAVTGVVELADAGVVPAADSGVSMVVPSLDEPLTSVKGFYKAVKTGNGWLAAMFLLFFFVGLIRVIGKRIHKMIPDDTKHFLLKPLEAFLRFVFDTKIGGWLLNWLSAVGGCLSTAAMAGLPVDAASWKVAILASTGGTALIELKDDVMEWWDARNAAAEAERAAKSAVVAPAVSIVPPPPAIPPVEPPKP